MKELGTENHIDRSYYNKLVDDAKTAIEAYGDFEWFASDDPYIFHTAQSIQNAGKEHNNGQ